MRKHCGNCAVYGRKNMKHSELCGKCVIKHFSNGKESDPSMWKPLPQTNADRIRAMSDEELAKWLLLFVRNCGAVNGNNIDWADGMEEKMLYMLKQPAEGE